MTYRVLGCAESTPYQEHPMIRKTFTALLAYIAFMGVLGTLLVSPNVFAGVEHSASHREFARTAIDNLFAAIRSDAKALRGDHAALEAIVLATIAPHADFEAMTQAVAGQAWRDMTAEERAALVTEFRMLLIRFYSGMLAQYADYDYRIVARAGHPAGGDATITVELRERGRPGGLVVRVNAVVRSGAGDTWKIVDLSVDGVSIVQSYRSGFRHDLKQLGVSGLIEKLRKMNGNAT